jgi:hypothetical protein
MAPVVTATLLFLRRLFDSASSGNSGSMTAGMPCCRILMFRQSGLTIGRKKHEIMRAGGKKRLEMTGVVVSSHVSMKREKRAVLRAMVHRCERWAEAEPESEECSTLLQKVSCRVGQLKRLHPAEHGKLHARVA